MGLTVLTVLTVLRIFFSRPQIDVPRVIAEASTIIAQASVDVRGRDE